MVTRRTIFDLKKAEARAHILEGLKIALDWLDAVIELIRGSKNPAEAKEAHVRDFFRRGMAEKAWPFPAGKSCRICQTRHAFRAPGPSHP
nr:DNA gyrase subunit A [Geotalea toluenoxydans]